MNCPDDPITQLAREIIDGGNRDRIELSQRWGNPSQWLKPEQSPVETDASPAGPDPTREIGRTDNDD